MKKILFTIFLILQTSLCFSEIPVNIRGIQGSGGAKLLDAHVHPFVTASGTHAGLVVLTNEFLEFDPEFHPFLNADFGADMAQNIAFSGTAELIFDGGDGGTEWTSTAIAGDWNFADSGKVTITTANNLDNAIWDDPETTDMSDRTALTGKVDLDIYNDVNNSIFLQFGLAGVNVGNVVNLDDFIDTGDFTEQSFAITKESFGLSTQTVDDMDITIIRIGGSKPTIKFDDLQIEQTGSPAVFASTTPEGTRFHVTELRIAIADNIASTVANGTMHGLGFDDFMGITSPLTNGIIFQRITNGTPVFSVNIKQLGDFLGTGSNIVNAISDGTNTFITLLIEFPKPIILDGDKDDFLSFTINDNLSDLLQFTAAARGALEMN